MPAQASWTRFCERTRELNRQNTINTLPIRASTKADAIKDEEPLFSPTEGLGLDSLSALELLSAIEYKYNVRFEGDGSAKEHFRSVSTLAAYLAPKIKDASAAA